MTANHTFVNERLALHYGIPYIRGERMRRVTLTDANRFGLLGKGAVLLATSYANRTAPVIRGAWILENLLGTPPAAPPPDVEAFRENKDGEKAAVHPRHHGGAPRQALVQLLPRRDGPAGLRARELRRRG